MMENCFYCGKEILTECDEYVIGAGLNKNGDMDYLVYCVDCSQTVKQLKSEHKQLLDALIDCAKQLQVFHKGSPLLRKCVKVPYLNLIEQITKKKWSEIE